MRMDARFNQRLMIGAAFSGVLYAVVVFGGWGLVADMILPPWSPEDNAAEVAQSFADDTQRIRVGMLLVMLAALLAIPFTAVVCQQLSRVEGGPGILTWSAALGGAALMVLTFYPAIFWLVAAYRPNRAEDLIKLMNDMAWLQFIGGVTIFLALPIAIAIAAFADTSPNPIFPRWAGYYNAWTILLIIPDQLLFFFKDGPFAWNGVFGFWIPAVVFGSWFFVTYYLLRQAIANESEPETAAGSKVAQAPVAGQ